MAPPSTFDVELESEKVKLVPFDVAKHASYFLDVPDDLYECIPMGPYHSLKEFHDKFWVPVIESANGTNALFAILDKTRDEALAGMIGYIYTDFANLSTEIGPIITLPAFQRTHVTSNAIGLLIQYALNLPGDPIQPGMGMRRLVWSASTKNEKSTATAQRMGFQIEAILRWSKVSSEKDRNQGNGRALRDGDPKSPSVGRDSVVLSICWDDWEGGVRDLVKDKMDRRV